MTPAVRIVQAQAVAHRLHAYQHTPGAKRYGAEAAEKLALPPDRVFKTLVVQIDDGALVTALVPVCGSLSLKRLAAQLGAKKAAMAEAAAVARVTGYVLGGVSPLGQRRRPLTVIDASALKHATIFVSAGRRGLELELAPADLQRLTGAVIAEISA